MTATAVTAVDHVARGALWPESVYGTAGAAWRWVEHAGWVVFEDVFLVYACLSGVRDIRATADREAELEAAHATVERKVAARTRELAESETRFRGAMDHAAIGMALVAPDGRFLRVNRALCAILGYADAELRLELRSLEVDRCVRRRRRLPDPDARDGRRDDEGVPRDGAREQPRREGLPDAELRAVAPVRAAAAERSG